MKTLFTVILLVLALPQVALAKHLVLDSQELIFSGVKEQTSLAKIVTLSNLSKNETLNSHLTITGKDATAFSLISEKALTLKANQSSGIALTFTPSSTQIGPLQAQLNVVADGKTLTSTALWGLSAIGVEGKREPAMELILETLGLKIDVGWSGLKNHTKPKLIGSEISQQQFKKAAPGMVNMLPVARYSPDFLLPFGYYISSNNKDSTEIELKSIGTLALESVNDYQHNTLYPRVVSGGTKFDPKNEVFGLFTSSPTHIAYSEDKINKKMEPSHVAHATRIYPARDRQGNIIENTYLICFEEATNGDYQDYVFLLSNVIPVSE